MDLERTLRLANLTLGLAVSLLSLALMLHPDTLPRLLEVIRPVIGDTRASDLVHSGLGMAILVLVGILAFFAVWTLFTYLCLIIRKSMHSYREEDYWFRSWFNSDVDGSTRRASLAGLSITAWVFVMTAFAGSRPVVRPEDIGAMPENISGMLFMLTILCGMLVLTNIFSR
jgi:hypothetical protein